MAANENARDFSGMSMASGNRLKYLLFFAEDILGKLIEIRLNNCVTG